MASGSRRLRGLRGRHLGQARSRPASPGLRLRARFPRDHSGRQPGDSSALEHVLRLAENPHLGVVRPFRPRHPVERSLLVADRRNGLAEPAPEKLPLQRHPGYLRRAGLPAVLAKLEARDDLGARDRARPESGSASLVLHLDPAAGRLAARLRLVRFLDHALRLFPVLE